MSSFFFDNNCILLFIYSIVYKEYRRKYQNGKRPLGLFPYSKDDNTKCIELDNKI